ncbi:porin, partial [Solemya velum gill symbiont]|uniref:porin n=2 Tax=Solemya velum gill symbiont TaxID=2340 RepID=UPI0011832528
FMKKSIIAAAIAVAVAAPAANAGVTLYGKVHVSIDYTQHDFNSDYDGIWGVYSRASRIGFKGTEDLGNGLSLIWKAETGYDFSDGGAWDSSGRNAYIGLTGDWGTFLYGRHDGPYKMAWYSTGIDMMGDTIMDANGLASVEENRFSNAIAYVSPNMNGLTFAAAIVPGEGTNNATGLTDGISVGVMYSNNGLKLAAAYEDEGDLGDNADDNDRFMIGAGYTMNAFSIAANYVDDDEDDEKSLNVSGSYSFGNNKLVLAYGHEDNDGGSDDVSWGVGLTHALSKRTTAYAAYASTDEEDTLEMKTEMDATSGFSIGLIHNF